MCMYVWVSEEESVCVRLKEKYVWKGEREFKIHARKEYVCVWVSERERESLYKRVREYVEEANI